MDEKELLNKIKNWLEFSIKNHKESMVELEFLPFPQWNKGYFECLTDLEKIINSTDNNDTINKKD